MKAEAHGKRYLHSVWYFMNEAGCQHKHRPTFYWGTDLTPPSFSLRNGIYLPDNSLLGHTSWDTIRKPCQDFSCEIVVPEIMRNIIPWYPWHELAVGCNKFTDGLKTIPIKSPWTPCWLILHCTFWIHCNSFRKTVENYETAKVGLLERRNSNVLFLASGDV